MIYRFKVTFEDNDEVYREIDIKSSQSFQDFHSVILSSIGFEDNCNASFFISDDMWRKGEEIILTPPVDEGDKRPNRKVAPPKYIMGKCKMAALIDDPHQKFIYIQDPASPWVFMVELIKIVPDDAKAKYPKCSKSVGTAPKKGKMPIVAPDILEDLEDSDDEEESIDDEAYVQAPDEIDLSELNDEGDAGIVMEKEEGIDEEIEEEEEEFGGLGDGVDSYDED